MCSVIFKHRVYEQVPKTQMLLEIKDMQAAMQEELQVNKYTLTELTQAYFGMNKMFCDTNKVSRILPDNHPYILNFLSIQSLTIRDFKHDVGEHTKLLCQANVSEATCRLLASALIKKHPTRFSEAAAGVQVDEGARFHEEEWQEDEVYEVSPEEVAGGAGYDNRKRKAPAPSVEDGSSWLDLSKPVDPCVLNHEIDRVGTELKKLASLQEYYVSLVETRENIRRAVVSDPVPAGRGGAAAGRGGAAAGRGRGRGRGRGSA